MAYCLVNDSLPSELDNSRKREIADKFLDGIGQPIVVKSSVEISHPYVREVRKYSWNEAIDKDWSDERHRFQMNKKALWVMVEFSEKEPEKIVPYIMPFRRTAEGFSLK